MIKTDKYIFFWRNEDIYSQWYKCQFKDINNIMYSCAEQYMMYQKALLFNDLEIASLVLNTNNQKTQKELGRKIKNFDESIWNENKEKIIYNGNYLKFTQNKDLLNEILNTDSLIFVEASPYDKIYGVGLLETDNLILDEKNWKGLNLLGKCLTKLRNNLKIEKQVLNKAQIILNNSTYGKC